MWNVNDWIETSGRTTSEVARRAGVSRSTINRIARGEVSPTMSTLAEIAFACDLTLTCNASPVADSYAAHAARLLLEAGFTTDDPQSTQVWLDRIERLGLHDPVEIVTTVGHWASPGRLPGAHFYTGVRASLRAASAGDSSRDNWAMSGVRVLGGDGVDVMHTENPQHVNAFLAKELTEVPSPAVADIIVVPATNATFYDSWTEGPIRYAAPIQAVIDATGIGGKDAQVAIREAREW